MPKPTITRTDRGTSRRGQGMHSAAYATPVEAPVQDSCDLCATLIHLKEQTIDGERVVVCIHCLKSAGADLSQWKKISRPGPATDVPIDARGLAQTVGTSRGAGDWRESMRKLYKNVRLCAYPECQSRCKGAQVACREHWELLTDDLQEEFKASFLKPHRRDVFKKCERYLAIRHRLRELQEEDGRR